MQQFIGCDAHKKFSVFVAVDERGKAFDFGFSFYLSWFPMPMTLIDFQSVKLTGRVGHPRVDETNLILLVGVPHPFVFDS